MKQLNKILIVVAIFLLFIALFWNHSESNLNSDLLREKLVSKGLPTPAFANAEELKKILNTY